MNSDKQISQLQTAIVKKPAVLIVDPVNLGTIVPTVQKAKQAGIKVYAFRPSPTDPKGLWDGAADEGALETKMADNMRGWMQSQVTANPNLVFKVGVIYGAAAQTPQLIRGDVIKALAKSDPSKVQVVAEKFADWALQKAQDATANFITAHPDMNLVVTANNQMGQGAVNAIKSAGKTGAIQLATYDVNLPTVQAIEAGTIAYDTGFEQYGYGEGVMRQVLDLALGSANGQFDVPLLTITKSNAASVASTLHS